jgi:hypothetical protein
MRKDTLSKKIIGLIRDRESLFVKLLEALELSLKLSVFFFQNLYVMLGLKKIDRGRVSWDTSWIIAELSKDLLGQGGAILPVKVTLKFSIISAPDLKMVKHVSLLRDAQMSIVCVPQRVCTG